MGVQAVARLPQLVFAVLPGQAPGEGDEVDVPVGVGLLHLAPLRSQLPEVVADPAQGGGEQNEQRHAQEVEEDAGRRRKKCSSTKMISVDVLKERCFL